MKDKPHKKDYPNLTLEQFMLILLVWQDERIEELELLHRIEDFPGVVILSNKQKMITKDKIDELVEEWRQSRGDFDTFTGWLEDFN